MNLKTPIASARTKGLALLPRPILNEIASEWLQRGELWLPQVVAVGRSDGWYWKDTEDEKPTWHGPFDTERVALLNAIETHGLQKSFALGNVMAVTGLELCIKSASEQSPGDQLEDLLQLLRELWCALTPAQKLVYMARPDVQQKIGQQERDDAFDQLVAEQRDVMDKSEARTSLLERLILEFPGLVSAGQSVNGDDLVGFLRDEVSSTYQMAPKQV